MFQSLLEKARGLFALVPVCLVATLSPTAVNSPAVNSDVAGITYGNRIAKLVRNKCASCHRENGVAPFSLETYEQVKGHAPMIRHVVQKGIMPPWFAKKDPGHGDGAPIWKNDRSLSETERADLLEWIEKGMPRGAGGTSAVLPETSKWRIGQPDKIVQLPRPVWVKSEGTMNYVNVVVPLDFADERWVQAIEVLPTAKQVVHHVLVYAIPKGTIGIPISKEQLDGINGFLGIYVPGNGDITYPKGFAKRIPANSDLRVQIHYAPNGEATNDQTKVAFRFAAEKPEHEVFTYGIANVKLNIPPGDGNYEGLATIDVPEDLKLMSFLPHMHARGKACQYELVHHDGSREPLLTVPRYDHNWQLLYEYARPKLVRAGERIEFRAWFDNSKENPANPDARKRVRWGEQSADEMQLGYIEYYVTRRG